MTSVACTYTASLTMVKTYSAYALYFLAVLRCSRGQFPMSCQYNLTNNIPVCCPVPQGYTTACGYPRLGKCEKQPDVAVKNWPVPPDNLTDERLNWPHHHIQEACNCHGLYHGTDCSACAYGYSGEDCRTITQPIVRRNILQLNERERRVFVQVLVKAKNTSSGMGVLVPQKARGNATTNLTMVELSIYDMFQYIHYRTTHGTKKDCNSSYHLDFAHDGPGFPVWHRQFMLWLERKLREISHDPHFALPYWDWIAAKECEICANDLLGAINSTSAEGYLEDESPFSRWETLCAEEEEGSPRCGLCDPRVGQGRLKRNLTGILPPVELVEDALDMIFYEFFQDNKSQPVAFRAALENIHDGVHEYFGGHMLDQATSANDPIFIIHHVFVDKIFEVWLAKWGRDIHEYPYVQYQMGHLAMEPMVPFFPLEFNHRYFEYTKDLGYKYDTLCLSYQDTSECVNESDDSRRFDRIRYRDIGKPEMPSGGDSSRDNWKSVGVASLTTLILLIAALCLIACIVVYRIKHGLPLSHATYDVNRSSGIQGLRNPVYDVDYSL